MNDIGTILADRAAHTRRLGPFAGWMGLWHPRTSLYNASVGFWGRIRLREPVTASHSGEVHRSRLAGRFSAWERVTGLQARSSWTKHVGFQEIHDDTQPRTAWKGPDLVRARWNVTISGRLPGRASSGARSRRPRPKQ